METIIFLVFFLVIIPIVLIVQNQSGKEEYKDDKMPERVGKAVGTYAHGVANEVSSFVRDITESEDSRKKREQTWLIHHYIDEAISGKYYSSKDRLLEMFDDEQLMRYNVTAEDWKKVATKALAIGEIVKIRVWKGEVRPNNPKYNKEDYEGDEINDGKALRDALDYLGIPKEDWFKWGYATLTMYEVSNDIDAFLEKIV